MSWLNTFVFAEFLKELKKFAGIQHGNKSTYYYQMHEKACIRTDTCARLCVYIIIYIIMRDDET